MQSEKELRRFFLRNRLVLGIGWVLFWVLWLFTDSPVFLTVSLSVPVLVAVSLGVQVFVLRRMDGFVQMPSFTVQKNETVQGILRVTNALPIPIHCGIFVLECENTYTREKETLFLRASLSPKEKAEIPFTVQAAHCGFLQVSLRAVKSTDLFALIPWTNKAQKANAGVSVFPDVYPVELAFNPFLTDGYGLGDMEIDRKGADLANLFRLRAYEPGDSLRQIHWKLSEKTGTLVTREGSAETRDTLLVYWDPSGSAEEPDLADAMAQAVTSVCCALLDSGMRFSLVWSQGKAQNLQEDVTGENLRYRILEAIRRETSTVPMPETLSGWNRILHFSLHCPEQREGVTYIHGDRENNSLFVSPDHPMQELLL